MGDKQSILKCEGRKKKKIKILKMVSERQELTLSLPHHL